MRPFFAEVPIDAAPLTRQFGVMSGRQTSSETSLGRIAIAVALTYLLLIKALFLPFPNTFMLESSGPFGAFAVICSHESGTDLAEDGGGTPASHHDNCCDDGCLMRISALAPLILVLSWVLSGRLWRQAPVMRALARIATGPPWRISSRPQAQRAPPLFCFV